MVDGTELERRHNSLTSCCSEQDLDCGGAFDVMRCGTMIVQGMGCVSQSLQAYHTPLTPLTYCSTDFLGMDPLHA